MGATVFPSQSSTFGAFTGQPTISRDQGGILSAVGAAWKRIGLRGFHGFRGRTLLALGESYGSAGHIGKSVEAIRRLAQLNPALYLDIRCVAGGDLEFAASSAMNMGRNSVDLCIVFVDLASTTCMVENDGTSRTAESCLRTISRIARRMIVVSTPAENMDKTTTCVDGVNLLIDCAPDASLTLGLLCRDLDIEHVSLCTEDGSVSNGTIGSDNFSALGFSPLRDQPAMWTACMLQRSSIAQLVFQ